MLFLTFSWRFLIYNKLEQLNFKLKKLIGFQKHARKVRKHFCFFGGDEYVKRLEGKIRKCLFFYVEILENNSVKLVSYCIFLVGNLGLMASIPSFLPLSTSKMRPLWNTQFSPKILFLSSLPAFCVPKMKVISKLHRNRCYFGNTLFLMCFGKFYDFFLTDVFDEF